MYLWVIENVNCQYWVVEGNATKIVDGNKLHIHFRGGNKIKSSKNQKIEIYSTLLQPSECLHKEKPYTWG